jgi:hypothetical protein
MKTNIKDSNLFKLIRYVINTGNPWVYENDDRPDEIEMQKTREELRNENPRIAEAAEKVAQGDRTPFGLPESSIAFKEILYEIEKVRNRIDVVLNPSSDLDQTGDNTAHASDEDFDSIR